MLGKLILFLNLYISQDILIDDPLSQDLLFSNKTYMLTAGPKNIYLWIGRFTSKLERRTANEVAEKFRYDNKMPRNTKIELVLEGIETASFKQFFPSWDDMKNIKTTGKVVKTGRREGVFAGPTKVMMMMMMMMMIMMMMMMTKVMDKPDWNIKTLHRRMEDKIERNVQGYIGFMPKGDEEGLGRKTVWRIENFRPVEVRDLSSFPMYKNKTLPSPRGKKQGMMGDKDKVKMMRSEGEGMMQGQAFLHSSHCYVILYK